MEILAKGAEALIKKDELLKKHPLLARALTARTQMLHFE